MGKELLLIPPKKTNLFSLDERDYNLVEVWWKDLLDEKISGKFFKNYGTFLGVHMSNIVRVKNLKERRWWKVKIEKVNNFMKRERGFEMLKTPGAHGK